MTQVISDLKFAGIVTDRDNIYYRLPKRERERRELEERNKIGRELPSLIDIDRSKTACSTVTDNTIKDSDSNRGRPVGSTNAEQK
jgi:hypothetical protein